MTLPAEHLAENQKLTADASVDLFQIIMRSGSRVYLKSNNDVTWQGHLFEGIGIQVGGVGDSTDQEANRPELQISNPKGLFSTLVRDGELDRATLIRYRVLRANLEADLNIYASRTWTIWKPKSLIHRVAVFELRTPSDGYNFITPARMFMPPEFPMVSLR